MLHNKAGWVGRMLLSVTVLLSVSCGNSKLDVASGPHASANAASVASGSTRRASHVAGQFLARVSVTTTHTVEFWEIKPGSVAMVQLIKPGGTDKSLDLGPMLRNAGGSYGGLYRQLMNDPNATLSPEMVAADERRSHLPIRDASLPLPARPAPPHPPRTHGTPAVVPSQASANIQLGTLSLQSMVVDGGDVYDNSGITDFDCNGPEVDGGWCPPGAYNSYIYGESDEVIYYDVDGYNPQNYPSDYGYENDDTFYIWENDANNPDAGWVTDLDWDLWPNETLRVTFAGSPAQFFGEVDGNVVAFADRYRLSFPSLSFAYNGPSWNEGEGTFANDIEGIAHAHCPGAADCDPGLWFFSRTEFSEGDSVHGQIGISGDLGGVAYNCTHDEPSNWWSGTYHIYAHYGDIVYEPVSNPVATGMLVVSLNDKDNNHAGVGFLGVVPTPSNQCGNTLVDWGTVMLSAGEQAPCVAVTHKYLNKLVSPDSSGRSFVEEPNDVHLYIPSSAQANLLHEYIVDYPTDTLVWGPYDTKLINANGVKTPVNNPNGLKVSSHGKLYMWGVESTNFIGMLYGIDPFSGVIQTQFAQSYGRPQDSLLWTGVESEGLDIVDPTDVGLTSGAPEILLQILADSPVETDQWQLTHLSVSDASRL